jgi:hypothetical protein
MPEAVTADLSILVLAAPPTGIPEPIAVGFFKHTRITHPLIGKRCFYHIGKQYRCRVGSCPVHRVES